MFQVHLPQQGKIAGGPSAYFENPELENRVKGVTYGEILIDPSDTTKRNFLLNRVKTKTGSALLPRSTVSR